MSSKEIEILYRRQCKYSDYLDSLQRSSQRYYFITIGAFIGIIATIYGNMHPESPDHILTHTVALNKILGIASIGAVSLLTFGFLTLLQLARLRSLNIKTDRIIRALEQDIASDTYVKDFFVPQDERTDLLKFGNDWCKASFVALGNTACVYVIFRFFSLNTTIKMLFPKLFIVPYLIILLLLVFDLSLLLYGFFISYRFEKIDKKISRIHPPFPAYKSTIFIRFFMWITMKVKNKIMTK